VDDEALYEYLGFVMLKDKILRFDKKLDAMVGERGFQ